MPKLADGNVQVTAVVSEDLVEWLDLQAKRNDRSRSWLIAHALEHFRAANVKGEGDNGASDPASYELVGGTAQ